MKKGRERASGRERERGGSKRKKEKEMVWKDIDKSRDERRQGRFGGRDSRVNIRGHSQASWQAETVWIVNCKWTQWTEKGKDHWTVTPEWQGWKWSRVSRKMWSKCGSSSWGRPCGDWGAGGGVDTAADAPRGVTCITCEEGGWPGKTSDLGKIQRRETLQKPVSSGRRGKTGGQEQNVWENNDEVMKERHR